MTMITERVRWSHAADMWELEVESVKDCEEVGSTVQKLTFHSCVCVLETSKSFRDQLI